MLSFPEFDEKINTSSSQSEDFTCTVLFTPQMAVSARTATRPASPALETRSTGVQHVQKVCESLLCQVVLSAVSCFHGYTTSYPAVMMFTLSSSSHRAVLDHAANMCVQVSGGVLCQPAQRCVRGLPPRLFTVCGRSSLHPLPEHSQGSVVPAGRTVCPAVCQVRGQAFSLIVFLDHIYLLLHPETLWVGLYLCSFLTLCQMFDTSSKESEIKCQETYLPAFAFDVSILIFIKLLNPDGEKYLVLAEEVLEAPLAQRWTFWPWELFFIFLINSFQQLPNSSLAQPKYNTIVVWLND